MTTHMTAVVHVCFLKCYCEQPHLAPNEDVCDYGLLLKSESSCDVLHLPLEVCSMILGPPSINFLVQIAYAPAKSKLASGPARLHLLDYMFCLTAGVPPKLLGIWPLRELRRFGVVDGKFCFEGGSRCGK
ncbi:protein Dok-7, partial [Trichonephila clavipes]